MTVSLILAPKLREHEHIFGIYLILKYAFAKIIQAVF